MTAVPDQDATAAPFVVPGTCVRFHPLVVVREPGREPLLGCERSRRFVEVDDDTLSAVALIDEAPALAEAEAAMEHCTGEQFDLAALVTYLAERNFVATVDGVPVNAEPTAAERHPLLYRAAPDQLAWLRGRRLRTALLVLVGCWLAALVRDPWLLPGPADLRLGGGPLVGPTIVFAALLVTAYVHELAHFFVARSYGVDATIATSRRLVVAVLQTDVTNAWRLPARQRLAIFLAGSVFNLAVVAATGLALVGVRAGVVPDPGRNVTAALGVIGYVNFLPLIFQLAFFARTDFYFVLLALTGQRNLRGDANNYLTFRVRRAWRRARGHPTEPCARCAAPLYDDDPLCLRCADPQPVADPNRWSFPHSSRHRLLAYALVVQLGQLAALAYLLTVGLAVQVYLLDLGATSFVAAVRAGSVGAAAQAVLFLVLYGGQLALVATMLARPVRRIVARLLPLVPRPRAAHRPEGA